MSCALNLASSQLRLNNYAAASETCGEVLARDANNVKALYRRALASRELSRLEAAAGHVQKSERLLLDSLADVSRAQAFEPADASIQAACEDIKTQLDFLRQQSHTSASAYTASAYTNTHTSDASLEDVSGGGGEGDGGPGGEWQYKSRAVEGQDQSGGGGGGGERQVPQVRVLNMSPPPYS
jgi:hypothetical protein